MATYSVNQGVKRVSEDLEEHGVECTKEGKELRQSVQIWSDEVSTEGRAVRKSLLVLVPRRGPGRTTSAGRAEVPAASLEGVGEQTLKQHTMDPAWNRSFNER